MPDHDQVDALFAEVVGFLIDSEASNASTPQQDQSPKADPDSLLVSSHQLLAETETLLSSLERDANSLLGVKPASRGGPISAERRREIRNAQASVRRTRYRQKIKNERDSLRHEEAQLSLELTKLHQARAAAKKQQVDKMTLNMWRAIATRQKERRVEAEAQQRQLRAAVIGRARLIHQMNALLSQRPSAEDEKSNLWQNQCDDDGQKNESGLLQTFIGELDDMYARTDQITAEMEFKMSSPLVYKPAKTFKHGVEVFDSADATVIPFGFEETCRATSLLMMTDPSAVRYGDVCEVQKNTVTAKYQVQCQLSPGERSRLMIHVAVRRYQEPGRLVFVWRALNEGLEALYGYHSDERGWLVLRPHNGDYPSTIMESYVRFVPVSVGCNKEDTDRFAEVVVKTGEEEVNEMMKMLEKILLTEAN